MEGLQEQYGRWILGIGRQVPGYIVREAIDMEKVRVRVGYIACKFEEKVRMGKGGELLKKCMKERERVNRKGRVRDKEREKYLNRCGWSGAGIDLDRRGGFRRSSELRDRDRDVQKQERRDKIRKSEFNPRYKDVVKEGVAEYWSRYCYYGCCCYYYKDIG